jgi:hypothetical protein
MVAKRSVLFCFGDVIDPLGILFPCVVFRYYGNGSSDTMDHPHWSFVIVCIGFVQPTRKIETMADCLVCRQRFVVCASSWIA